MKEKYHIDMEQTQYNKTIDEIPKPDILISMGCGVQCPLMDKDFDDDWNLMDPSGKEDEVFIEIIEQIKEKVLQLKKYHHE